MKNIFFFFLVLFLCSAATAQDRSTLGITYQYGLPVGDLKKNFVDRNSARGVQIDLMYQLNPKWRLGGAVGYQDFYQQWDRQLYRLEDGSDLSAVRSHSLQTIPVLVKAMYLPLPDKKTQPYITAGAGANLVQVQELYGGFDNVNDMQVGFAAQAGAGLKYFVTNRTALQAGAVYNYMPFNKLDIGAVSHVAVQAGIRFTLRNDGRGGGRSGDWYNNDNGRQPRNRNRGW